MMEKVTIMKDGDGKGTIASLEKVLYKAKANGATHYSTYVLTERNYSYIQFVEYYRELSPKEVYENEKKELEAKIVELNKKISGCK